MRRRWFGVFLMAWALVAPLFAFTQPAFAAGETYSFTTVGSTNVIVGHGFTGMPLGVIFRPSGLTYTGTGAATLGSPAPTFVIGGLTKDTTVGGYNSVITTTSGTPLPRPDGAIYITDPNSRGPFGGSPPITPKPPAGAPGPGASATTCNAGPGFTWIICGIITQIVGENGIVNSIQNDIIVPFLKVKPYTSTDANGVNNCKVAAGCPSAAFGIWSAFRNIASVFFILVFFLIIIGTAVGFDNYTIKKVLPHLIAGAILIPFSWYLCAFVIDIGNVLGQGIAALINPIIGPTTIDLDKDWGGWFGLSPASVGTAVVGFALIQAGAASAGLGAAITILLALLGVFLTLIMRQILITLMVVMSPFALLAWILPNTEKWFKTWWQNFFKLVMMYPIIMLLFEAGRLFAKTTGATNPTAAGWVTPLIQVTALILPLFAVPFAFKFAGSGLALAGSAVNKVTGAVDKKYGKDSSFANDLKEGRTRKNFEASNKASNAAEDATGLRKLGLQRKAAFQMRRAGLSGIGGSARLRRQAATPKLAGELDALDGEKRTKKELDRETWDQRRAAGTQSFVDERAKTRAGRQGLLDAYEKGGRPVGSTTQAAERIKARDNYLAGIGDNQGVIKDDRLNERERINNPANYVSPATRVGAARDTAALRSADARGTAQGVVRGGIEAEAQIREQTGLNAAGAADLRLRKVGQAKTNVQMAATVTAQQTANTNVTANMELDQKQITDGNAITLQQARSMRLQNLSAATHGQERERISAAEGQIDARNDITATAGHEDINKLVTGERLAAREQLATARTLRDTRAGLQDTPEGHQSTAEVLAAGRIEAGKRLGASIGAQKQELSQEQADIEKAREERRPAPTLGDRVTAGIEAAKPRTAQESAQRLAAVNAVRDNKAASTREHTDLAVQAAERATTLANATTKGGAAVLTAQVESRARDIKARATAMGITASDANAKAVASKNLRSETLKAVEQTGRAAAVDAKALEISNDLGGNDTLDKEIGTEETRLLDANPTLDPAQARTDAEVNVEAQRIAAVSKVGRSQGAVKTEADRQKTVGVEDSIKSQEVEEADRLQSAEADADRPPLDPAVAAARAQANVRNNQIEKAGKATRQKAAREDRQTTDSTANIAAELDHAVALEQEKSGSSLEAAEDVVRARDLNQVGVNAGDAALRKAGAERGTEAGTSLAIEAELDNAIYDIQKTEMDAGRPKLPDADARARAQANVKTDNIKGASRAAQIVAQGARIKATRTEKGTIETYDAAIDAAANKPTAEARTAAYNAAFDQAVAVEANDADQQVIANEGAVAIEAGEKAVRDLEADAIRHGTTNTPQAIDAARNQAIADSRTKTPARRAEARRQAMETIGQVEGHKAGKDAAANVTPRAPLSQDQAERNLVQSIGVAAEEQAMRTESQVQSTVEAYNQAVNSTEKLGAKERLEVQTESAIAQLATESGSIRERSNLTSPGQALNRTYQQAESSAAKVAREQILRGRVAEESKGAFKFTDKKGNTVVSESIDVTPLSEEGIAALGQEVRQLLSTEGGKKPQTARAIAIMNRLTQSGPSQEELRGIATDVFGGTDSDVVDPTLFDGQAQTIWSMGSENAKAPDMRAPRIAAYSGVPPKEFTAWDWRTKRDYFKFILRKDAADPAQTAEREKVEGEAAENIAAFVTDPRQASNLDGDQVKSMGMFLFPPTTASAERIALADRLKDRIRKLKLSEYKDMSEADRTAAMETAIGNLQERWDALGRRDRPEEFL